MNRLIPLIALVVLVAALTGAAIGWRFPFFGQRRTAQQLDTAQSQQNSGTRVQPANQPRTTAGNNRRVVQPANQPGTTAGNNRRVVQPANQPGTTAQNNAQSTAQDTDATLDPEASGTTGEAGADQPVPALW